MKKITVFLLAIWLTLSAWSVNYSVSVASSDPGAGYVEVSIPNGDVDGETDYDTDSYGGEVSFSVRSGRKVTLNASVNDEYYYYFAGWSNGQTKNPLTLTVKSDVEITANFEPYPFYTITADIQPAEVRAYAYVWSDYLDDGENSITAKIDETVYLSLDINEDHYRFLGWFDAGTQVSTDEAFSVKVNGDKTYTARFEQIPVYTVTSATQPEGLFADEDIAVYSLYLDDYSNEIMEGEQYLLNAPSNGEGLSSYLAFDHWESDKGGYTTSQSYQATATQDEHWTAVYKPDYGGYQQIGTSNLYYKDNSISIDIKGMDGNRFYQSTYADGGYHAAIKVGDDDAQTVTDGLTLSGVQVNTSVRQSGALAMIAYTVTNTSSSAKKVSLGTYADVQIGNNDQAPVQPITDDEGKTLGILMKDGEMGQLYVLFGLGTAGLSVIDDYWFGSYGYNSNDDQIVGNYDANTPYWMEPDGDYDSAMGWCWKNRTLSAGQSVVYSFLIGIGEVIVESAASLSITPVDITAWNDLSVPHDLYVEGVYTNTSGIDGYIDYAVEDGDWITLKTEQEQARLRPDEAFLGTIRAQFDPAKTLHTIRFRTRDILGNTSALPSVTYEDMSPYHITGGITDRTYTGSPLTQSNLTADLPEDRWQVTQYWDNVNAGTAHFWFEGRFPYTIGRKEYTFTVNPKTLGGELIIDDEELVYDGTALTPEWYFSEWYSLDEGTDYITTWENNILPGTARLTVTGTGNWTGSLTTDFVIHKRTVTPDLYRVTLPENAFCDGQPHTASVQTAEGLGAASLTYWVGDEQREPVESGEYEVRLSLKESDLYYGITDVPVGTFRIGWNELHDLELLRAAYERMDNGASWTNKWDLTDAISVQRIKGLSFADGYVTAIDLSNNNLTGTIPAELISLPRLNKLDISHNAVTAIEPATSNTLSVLDISDNRIAEIAEVVNALPNLTELAYEGQAITKAYSLFIEEPVSMQTMRDHIPDILTFRSMPDRLRFDRFEGDQDSPEWQAYLHLYDEGYLWTDYGYGDFKRTPEDTVWAWDPDTYISFPVMLSFARGDADFNGTTDVFDLQAVINYIFGEYDWYADRSFNFTAANLYEDKLINVQDVIRLVDLLMTKDLPILAPRTDNRTIYSIVNQSSNRQSDQTANSHLFWLNGELHLFSDRPVAALDIYVASDSDIEWLLPDMSFKSQISNHKSPIHLLAWSLAGNTIPDNTDVVVARTTDSDATTLYAALSDRQAKPLEVVCSNQTYDVTTGSDLQQPIANSQEPIANAVSWTLYTLLGQQLASGTMDALSDRSYEPGQPCLLILKDKDNNVVFTAKISK